MADVASIQLLSKELPQVRRCAATPAGVRPFCVGPSTSSFRRRFRCRRTAILKSRVASLEVIDLLRAGSCGSGLVIHRDTFLQLKPKDQLPAAMPSTVLVLSELIDAEDLPVVMPYAPALPSGVFQLNVNAVEFHPRLTDAETPSTMLAAEDLTIDATAHAPVVAGPNHMCHESEGKISASIHSAKVDRRGTRDRAVHFQAEGMSIEDMQEADADLEARGPRDPSAPLVGGVRLCHQ